MLAFEILMGFITLIIILFSGSPNLCSITSYQNKAGGFIFALIPLALIFFVIMLAETNRTPFDLAEAEAELVSGYNTEYSGFAFAAFFLGEYLNILSISALFVIFF